jgi:lysozyme family protein
MSTFELAIPTILRHEGRFSDNSADPGGATNYGVSLRWLRSQGLLEVLKQEEGDSTETDIQAIRNMTQTEAEGFYRVHWWDRYEYGEVDFQVIATKIFDTAVNLGPTPAHKIAQKAVNALGSRLLICDGMLGAQTTSALNSSPTGLLLPKMQGLQADYYRDLVIANPKLEVFLTNWINRAYDKN